MNGPCLQCWIQSQRYQSEVMHVYILQAEMTDDDDDDRYIDRQIELINVINILELKTPPNSPNDRVFFVCQNGLNPFNSGKKLSNCKPDRQVVTDFCQQS